MRYVVEQPHANGAYLYEVIDLIDIRGLKTMDINQAEVLIVKFPDGRCEAWELFPGSTLHSVH